MESHLGQLKELSNYLSELESELNTFWLINPALCVIADHEKFLKLNPTWTRMMGYSIEEGLSKPFKEFIHPDDLMTTDKNALDSLSNGSIIYNFVNRYKHKDGRWVYLSWTAWQEQLTKKIYAVAVDITARLLARRRLEQTLDNCPIGVFLYDSNCELTYANKRMLELVCLSFDDIKGKGWIQLIHSEDLKDAVDSWYEFTKNAKEDPNIKYEHFHRYINCDTKKVVPVKVSAFVTEEDYIIGYVEPVNIYGNQ